MLGGGPTAVDRARSLPAGATGALGDRRPRGAHGDQRTQPAGQVGPRHPGEPGVDHDADTRHGQAALRQRGRQDDPTARSGLQRGVLRSGRQPAVQGQDVGVDPAQPSGDGADLTGAGQEDQQVAGLLGQRARDGRGDVREQPRVDPEAVRGVDRAGRRRPDDLDLVQRAGSLDDRGGSPSAPSSAARRCAWAVADMATSCRSGRSAARTSRQKASARSVSRCRSWHSSRTTASTRGAPRRPAAAGPAGRW